jgi:hypothetical protein
LLIQDQVRRGQVDKWNDPLGIGHGREASGISVPARKPTTDVPAVPSSNAGDYLSSSKATKVMIVSTPYLLKRIMVG